MILDGVTLENGVTITPPLPDPNVVFTYSNTTSAGIGFFGNISNVTVFWGDGNSNVITTPGVIGKTYATLGTYDVTIVGTEVGTINIYDNKLTAVKNWGNMNTITYNLGSTTFGGSTSLVSVPNSIPTFTNAIKFANCSSFNDANVTTWNTANITDMTDMFNGATVFNQDLTGWCVSNIGSEPSGFATGSALTSNNKPIWGTCP